MKVNGNDPQFAQRDFEGRGYIHASMPIRLEIAARILAAKPAAFPYGEGYREENRLVSCRAALQWADDLIAAHNETCGGEG